MVLRRWVGGATPPTPSNAQGEGGVSACVDSCAALGTRPARRVDRRALRPFVMGAAARFELAGATGPGADVVRSRRRCGQVPAQMRPSPGADVGRS